MRNQPPIRGGHATPPAQLPELTSTPLDCQTAFQHIADHAIRDIRRHHPAACQRDAEAIHGMRIALTQLRAAVAFFAPITHDRVWPLLKRELAWLNSELGKARDCHVTLIYAAQLDPDWVQSGNCSLVQASAECDRLAAQALCSSRYQRWIAAVSRWIVNGPWIQEALPGHRMESAASYGERRFRHWKKTLLRNGRELRALSSGQMHRLRIKAKRFRYMADAFEKLGMLSPAWTGTAYDGAKRIHRALGDLRDLKRLRKAGRGRPPGYGKRKRALLKEAADALRRSAPRGK
ncbi:CHAD domain-containing protein [Bradyrhizobium sp. dw_78]|uniref:CHAD domain-containing protein n=1 Tax=Bradyrhizobium sp. dw_78 TaxID=2719793 RepID=UPI001BD3E898|nr:CHAD domain-containing protein [Bradyrhizobium sp. dw_78]